MASVLAIDLAPRHTGFCWLPDGWAGGRSWSGSREVLSTDQVTYSLTGKMSPEAQMRVYLTAAEVAVRKVKAHGADVVVIEDYAYGAQGTAKTLLSELGGVVKSQLWMACHNMVAVPVSASAARAWLTGGLRGKRKTDAADGIKPLPKKKQVQVFLRNRGFTFDSEDILDSFVVGYYHQARLESRDPFFEPARPEELVVPVGVRRGRRGRQ